MTDEAMNKGELPKEKPRKGRRGYVRSKYLFPVYDMNIGLDVAKRVDADGAGSLSAASLAMSLGLSAKSSGFDLRLATARQFGLVDRRGDMVINTELAKGILRYISEEEKSQNLFRAFYNIDLFKAIGDRFQGVPLPNDATLRNLFEREFGVKRDRVGQALSTFLNSARIAGVLKESQGKMYLIREPTEAKVVGIGQPPKEAERGLAPEEVGEPLETKPSPEPIVASWNFTVDTKDLAGMEADAIKAAMEGLERLAKLMVQKQGEFEEKQKKT